MTATIATPASGYSPYCTVEKFLFHCDERSVRQLMQDINVPVTGSITENELLKEMLKSASGEVESAACTGQRYVVTDDRNDLADLTGNSAAFLAGMVAHLAFFRLWSRRPNMKVTDRPPVLCKSAMDFLDQLRLGERVFGILESHTSGSLKIVSETPYDVERRRGVVVEADRFYGRRNNRLGRR